MDFITCLPVTPAGNDTLVVWVDRLTKYVVVQPCKLTLDAAGFAQLTVDHIISKHGMPESFVSDRDVRFTSDFWTSLTKICGGRLKMSSAFHPQTDGQTKRMNRLLEETLRHFVSFAQSDWDSQIQLVAFAINNAHNVSVNATPFFLNKGLHPRVPCGICDLPAASESEPRAVSFSVQMQDNLAMAKKCLIAAQQRQKAQADKHVRELSFEAGELVLLSTRNLKLKNDHQTIARQKLLPKYIGPYKVNQVIGKVAYKLDMPGSTRIHPVFHVSVLRKFVPQAGHSVARHMPMPLDWLDHDPLFTVEAIVGHRSVKTGRKTTLEYKVRWAGFGPSYDEFRPRAILLTSVCDMIDAYDLLHNLVVAPVVQQTLPVSKQPARVKQVPARLQS